MIDNKIEKGRVSFVGKTQNKIITKKGELKAYIKGSLRYTITDSSAYPAVGDWVLYQRIDGESAVIVEILKRENKISRKVSGVKTEEQILATNIDNILICLSLDKNFNLNRIERYLFALETDVEPILVLTKKDLCSNSEQYIEKIKKEYPNLRVEVICSLKQEFGNLKDILSNGSTSVLIGSSGVGKSTLVNMLFGKEILHTKAVNKKSEKGRHTTTSRQLIILPNEQGYLIDTPGIRELSIWNTDEGEESFKEIKELAKKCRFKNCQHIHEPGCAVKKAVESGDLSERRYKNYIKLYSEYKKIEIEKNYQINQMRNKKIKNREEAKKRNRKIKKNIY
ncbi:ribosome small subunit-dependent GTPase A [uncultured Dubosiella sp.]|uniref:ribosome small subunit-dependent GTPase A n=3 Tax=uncultured Dubosiella sp. TaxID=1937011 RepID=UPI00259376CF|nr:ribosome small subunit-dependent GTPase A [uncultured Dubosiella sp.]